MLIKSILVLKSELIYLIAKFNYFKNQILIDYWSMILLQLKLITASP